VGRAYVARPLERGTMIIKNRPESHCGALPGR